VVKRKRGKKEIFKRRKNKIDKGYQDGKRRGI
jgi:hypothetical protein